MKVSITYFYNIRFFSSNMIPVSTAVYDPKWYHANRENSYVFLDKNGVYNGVRCPDLNPEKTNDHSCGEACKQNPTGCSFLEAYRKYVYSLNFNKVYTYFDNLCKLLNKVQKPVNEPEICLIVHEKPDNPCSERQVLVDWFKDNGIDVQEFVPRINK